MRLTPKRPTRFALFLKTKKNSNKIIKSYENVNQKIYFISLTALLLLNSINAKSQATFSSISDICISAGTLSLNPLVTPGGGTFSISSGGYLSTSSGIWYVDLTRSGSGTFTITYNVAPFPTQTIKIVGPLKITDNYGRFGPKITFNIGLPETLTVVDASEYSNFIWYKNGFPLNSPTCPSCSTIVVNDMGTYTVQVNGICGIEQDEIEIACDCNYGVTVISDHTYNTNTTITGTHIGLLAWQEPEIIDLVFSGTIIVAQNTVLTINNANIKMLPCTKIILEKGSGGNPGGKLYILGSTFSGCDKWQGIIIQGVDASDHTSAIHGFLEAADIFYISDAYKAMYSEDGGKLHLFQVYCENNENDLTIISYPKSNIRDYGFEDQQIHNIYIRGKWMHNDINDFGCTLYSFKEPLSHNSFKKMIYLEDVQYLNIDTCEFIGNEFLNNNNNITNAIELFRVDNINLDSLSFSGYLNCAIYGDSVKNLTDFSSDYIPGTNYIFGKYNLNGYFDKGIYFENSSRLSLGHYDLPSFIRNSFLGYMNYGIYLKNCEEVVQDKNIFNTVTYSSPAAAGGIINQAMYAIGSSKITASQNLFYNTTNGIYQKNYDYSVIDLNVFNSIGNIGVELYGTPTYSNSVNQNTFSNCTYGLIISPELNPVSASNTNNTNSSLQDVNISCNLFRENEFAIVGSGNIINQGSGTYTNGNEFDNNSNWDLCWMDFSSPLFQFYESSSAGSLVNTGVGMTLSNVLMNGTTITSSNFNSHFTTVGGKMDLYCFGNLLLSKPTSFMKEGGNSQNILNKLKYNIVVNELEIVSKNESSITLTCYDALGRIYHLEQISSDNEIVKFNTKDLASGIYYISLNNVVSKFYKIE